MIASASNQMNYVNSLVNGSKITCTDDKETAELSDKLNCFIMKGSRRHL